MTFQSNSSWLDSLGDNSLMHPGFTVIKPYVILELGSAKRRKGFTHFLEATGLINWQGRHWAPFYGPEQSEIERSGLRLNYFGTKRGPVSVFEYKATFESVNQLSPWRNSTTGRGQVEAKFTLNYIATKKKARSIELRGYWGKVGMLSDGRTPDRSAKTENMYLMLSGASGQQDVFYDEYFRGRNSAPTFANNSWGGQYGFTTNGQQRMNNMGGVGMSTACGGRFSMGCALQRARARSIRSLWMHGLLTTRFSIARDSWCNLSPRTATRVRRSRLPRFVVVSATQASIATQVLRFSRSTRFTNSPLMRLIPRGHLNARATC